MSHLVNIQTLYRYHFYTTDRLLERAGVLTDSDYRHHLGYGHGSIHDLFFHILRTDRNWRLMLATGRQQPPIVPEQYPGLSSLVEGYANERGEWEGLLLRYSDAALQANVSLTSWQGEPWTVPLWFVLQHVVLHGTQHHTEIAQLLTAKGRSPGDIDLVFFED